MIALIHLFIAVMIYTVETGDNTFVNKHEIHFKMTYLDWEIHYNCNYNYTHNSKYLISNTFQMVILTFFVCEYP